MNKNVENKQTPINEKNSKAKIEKNADEEHLKNNCKYNLRSKKKNQIKTPNKHKQEHWILSLLAIEINSSDCDTELKFKKMIHKEMSLLHRFHYSFLVFVLYI